jgi:hypothetical protein
VCTACAQTGAPAQAAGPAQTQAPPNPCVQPAPLISVADYTGPFRRVVLFVARKPEIKTVQRPSGLSGIICPLSSRQKFHLFVRNTFEPVTILSSAFDAGLGQAEDTDPTFGQGADGYGKRFGAALADRVSSDFFHTFAFPVIFRQDPRYYRLGEGATSARLGHALTHVFVAHGDSGKKMFNFSEWMGTAASVALGNTYHPGNRRGVGPASQRIAVSVGTDVGFDLLREFWPELVRKFKLPFREPAPPGQKQPPAKPRLNRIRLQPALPEAVPAPPIHSWPVPARI